MQRTAESARAKAGRLRRLPRILVRCVAGLLLLPLLYLLVALVLTLIPVHREWRPPQAGVEVFLFSNGVHTDFVLPVASAEIDWRVLFPAGHFRDVGPSWPCISFGWGDRGFYLHTKTFADLTIGTAFRAVFGLSPSAMHVEYCWPRPGDPQWRRLLLTEDQHAALVRFIRGSFAADASGRPLLIPAPGYWETDAFYEAKGRYSLLRTCNIWTNEGLKSIGVRTGVWSPFARGILYHLGE